MFQLDLNSDSKEGEQVLLYIIWIVNARILNMFESAEICPNVGKHASICVT